MHLRERLPQRLRKQTPSMSHLQKSIPTQRFYYDITQNLRIRYNVATCIYQRYDKSHNLGIF